jgi:hypothetical protein
MNRRVVRLLALALLLGVSWLSGPVPSHGQAQPQPVKAGLEVIVTGPDGAAIAGATVRVAALGVAGTTGPDGRLNTTLAVAAPTKIEATVEAKGFRPWTIRNATLLPDDTLIIEAPLSRADAKRGPSTPEVVDVQPHRSETDAPQTLDVPAHTPAGSVSANAAGTNTTPPTHIRVYRVSLGRVDTVEFRNYVKHVLPNEWIASWHGQSLRAGAMASKTYGWYRTMSAKYPGSGYDTKDTTADQVYNPNVSYASTNSAIDDTWNYRLVRNGAIFQTQYCAGTYNGSRTSGQCSEKHGFPVGNYASQWGSKYLADRGSSWQSILTFYYDAVTIAPIASTPGLPAWPNLRSGDSGPRVRAAQYLLRQRGYSLEADGGFGPITDGAVRAFQGANGLAVDGVIGPNTFQKLIVTVRRGDNNDAVRGIQTLLAISVDGDFGGGTEGAAKQLQAAYGLVQDGIVGPLTWQAAFGR